MHTNDNVDYDAMSMRQLMKVLVNNTDDVSDEEFETTIRRIMGSKVEEAMRIATDEAIKLYESELEKYIKREYIYVKALRHIAATENMSWQEKEEFPYNWKVARQAMIDSGIDADIAEYEKKMRKFIDAEDKI